jgi:integrase
VPDNANVDLTLVKLPPNTLVFPAVGVNLVSIRNPEGVTTLFLRHARANGFPGVRLHDIRAGHATALLDRGVPIHVVAARCGHDPAVLLRWHAKRSRNSDNAAAGIIGGILGGAFKG